jgi:hypothetical protein
MGVYLAVEILDALLGARLCVGLGRRPGLTPVAQLMHASEAEHDTAQREAWR